VEILAEIAVVVEVQVVALLLPNWPVAQAAEPPRRLLQEQEDQEQEPAAVEARPAV
jgi:hypothetical protein